MTTTMTPLNMVTGDPMFYLGITFDYDMIWSDDFLWSPIAAEVIPTIGGGIYKQEQAREERGRPITLIARNGFGSQQKSTVLALKAQADQAGTLYQLDIDADGQTISKIVSYRTEVTPSPVQMEPIEDYSGLPPETVWYHGTIFLMVDEWGG